jgi:hypothetical protein
MTKRDKRKKRINLWKGTNRLSLPLLIYVPLYIGIPAFRNQNHSLIYMFKKKKVSITFSLPFYNHFLNNTMRLIPREIDKLLLHQGKFNWF